MTRRILLVAALVSAAVWMAGNRRALAQNQNSSQTDAQQPAPDAPRPQKKAAAKTQTSAEAPSASKTAQPDASGKPASSTPEHSTAEDNPFPEDVSQGAAKSSESLPAAPSPVSKQSDGGARTTADDNPFPEDISKRAAHADGAANDSPNGSPPVPGGSPHDASPSSPTDPSSKAVPLPPGVSSSQASGLTGASGVVGNSQNTQSLEVTDPARSKKDTQVGDFYLAQGNSQGAYLRYKDAITYNPTNIEAIFGLARASQQLGKFEEAEHNYQTYLDITPNGPKAKQALRALSSLEGKR